MSIATRSRLLAADLVMLVWATGVFSWLAIKELARFQRTETRKKL